MVQFYSFQQLLFSKALLITALFPRQKEQLKKAIDKQSQLVNQDVKKTGVSRKMQKQMSALENSGTEMKEVEHERETYGGERVTEKVNVAVITLICFKSNFSVSPCFFNVQ